MRRPEKRQVGNTLTVDEDAEQTVTGESGEILDALTGVSRVTVRIRIFGSYSYAAVFSANWRVLWPGNVQVLISAVELGLNMFREVDSRGKYKSGEK